jgi:uncharacterized protein (TIGR02246 family)
VVDLGDAQAWAESFFSLVDRGDADSIATSMTPDGALISSNGDPIVGRDAIRDAVNTFQTAITSISHEILRTWRTDDAVITELRVTYVRLDGGKVVLPCANIFDITDDGLVSKYQIFMDMTPVFS